MSVRFYPENTLNSEAYIQGLKFRIDEALRSMNSDESPILFFSESGIMEINVNKTQEETTTNVERYSAEYLGHDTPEPTLSIQQISGPVPENPEDNQEVLAAITKIMSRVRKIDSATFRVLSDKKLAYEKGTFTPVVLRLLKLSESKNTEVDTTLIIQAIKSNIEEGIYAVGLGKDLIVSSIMLANYIQEKGRAEKEQKAQEQKA